MTKEFIADEMRKLQLYIVNQLEIVDGKGSFCEDQWFRKEGGGGYTMTFKDGNVIEKGGVAFSAVHGPVSEVMKKQLKLDGKEFFATGVSIVLHPNNPWCPIIHMNVRYFELDSGDFWFGGGIDLTPHYIREEQAALFHQGLKDVCDRYHSSFYDTFKSWADEYFYLPHRDETRGVGGIFFDHQNDLNLLSKEDWFSFTQELGRLFPVLYKQQVQLNKDLPFDENNIEWRNHRRGRYVEFNLVHDRGTKFGLLSGGRTESILMSLPPQAEWTYDFHSEPNSLEHKTLDLLKKDVNWLSFLKS